MSLTRDYVMRMVKQLAQGLARVMGLRQAGRLEEALEALGDTQRDALGDADGLVGKVDSQTAARLLGHKETVLMYAELLAERAEILSAMEDAEGARRSWVRSLQLGLEAGTMGPGSDEKMRSLIQRTRGHVDAQTLSERYATLLPKE